MKTPTTNLTANLFRRNKTPGFAEICSLINLDEEPAVLIDREMGCLLFINSRLIKLSSFSPADLWEKPVSALFPDLDLSNINSGEIKNLELRRKENSIVRIKARSDFLDQNARWLRIRVITGENQDGNQIPFNQQIQKYLLDVNCLGECNSFETACNEFIKCTKELLGAGEIIIYQADPLYPQLKKITNSENTPRFPETLPSSDLFRLSEVMIWKPGNRMVTEIHRFSRVNNLNYLATAPLKQGSGVLGLIVIGGFEPVPSYVNSGMLEIIAAQFVGLMQHFMLVKNLLDEIRSIKSNNQIKTTAIDAIQEGLVVLNPDLFIQDINPAAELMLGYASGEVRNQSYENILIGTDRLLPALEEAQRGVPTHNIGKASLNRRSGQSFPVQIQVLPILEEENVTGIEVIITDISENEQSKLLTQQLEHRAVLGDYTAAFAHDVRNPINNISTGIQLLSAKLAQDDPNQEVISRMQNDCTRLNHLMESFLAFSRPIEPRIEQIDVELFLRRIIDRWRPRLARVNVTPVLHVDENLSKMSGDSRSLDQVFTNLISNALDAMTVTGDTLAVRAVMNNEIVGHPQIEISVSDNGPGIPDDIRDRIFEPFVTTRKQGTGLGLAITKQIVTAHKGSISVKSFPGGTVFTVCIPASDGE